MVSLGCQEPVRAYIRGNGPWRIHSELLQEGEEAGETTNGTASILARAHGCEGEGTMGKRSRRPDRQTPQSTGCPPWELLSSPWNGTRLAAGCISLLQPACSKGRFEVQPAVKAACVRMNGITGKALWRQSGQLGRDKVPPASLSCFFCGTVFHPPSFPPSLWGL